MTIYPIRDQWIVRWIRLSALHLVPLIILVLCSGRVIHLSAQDLLEPVIFSQQGGFYTNEFVLELSHSDPDVTIIFSLDGSDPDPGHLGGTFYTHMDRYRSSDQQKIKKSFHSYIYNPENPIEIRDRTMEANYFSRMQSTFEQDHEPYYFPIVSVYKGTVVRAKAVKEVSVTSPIETHTYFISSEGRRRFTLPVLSIAIREDHFFDYESGIYVPGKIYDEVNPVNTRGDAQANHTQRGIEWERKASLELFEPESAIADLRQDFGVRIHGGWSRAHPMKSLRLYARSEYGDNRFRHQMFPDEPYTVFNRLILRNSGNDWPEAMMRDPLMQEIVKHMKVDTQAYRPYVIFLNGEYWGIHNMRERYDKHYLARKYGVKPENIDMLTGNGWVQEGNNHHYRQTMDYIREHGLQDSLHYNYINSRIDVENYIDYQISHIFVANTDWPGNNVDFWRYRTEYFEPEALTGQDGRWRWLIIDTDFGFHLYSGCDPDNDLCTPPDHNTLAFAARDDGPGWPNPPWSTELFRALLTNEQFRTEFITRYLDQLNTAFLPDRLQKKVMEIAGNIEPEMEEHLERWFARRNWHHYSRWLNLINERLLPFAIQRPAYARAHLRNFFEIGMQHKLTVDVSDPAAGYVQVNTVHIAAETPGVSPDPWPWSGTYFEGIPVVLEAHALPGYRFSHWTGENRNYHLPVLRLNLTDPESVKAVFYPDHEAVMFPGAHSLREGAYKLNQWPANKLTEWPELEPERGYPEHMVFVYMDEVDPGLNAGIAGYTEGIYNLDSRTRINGLGEGGFAFINTSNGNVGYPETRLGGAILAINTRRIRNIQVKWEGGTVRPNSRIYNLRLQYRVGNEGSFKDVLDKHGNPVEYKRNDQAGHRSQLGPVNLPEEAEDKGYVQLLWRYYHSGIRLDDESGQRSKMSVSNILVEGLDILDEELDLMQPSGFAVFQNYPNPFNRSTIVGYELPESNDVRVDIYDMLGRRVETLVNEFRNAGAHFIHWDASDQASGMYIYRIQAGNYVEIRTMTLVK